jgi:hypothetical protein
MPATATISTAFAILGKSIMLEYTGFLPHLQISDAGISAKAFRDCTPDHLTNRCNQPLAGAMIRFDFMKQLSMLRKLAPASDS